MHYPQCARFGMLCSCLFVCVCFVCTKQTSSGPGCSPSTKCDSGSSSLPRSSVQKEGGDYELINLQGKISGGQRRGGGSELSIWDYPDLMVGIKQPMASNPLSIRADFRHIDVWCCAAGTLQPSGRGLHSRPPDASSLSFNYYCWIFTDGITKC